MERQIKDSVEAEKAKQLVVLLIGPPGSGKSTFCETVMRSSQHPWSRICQDIVNNGKAGTKAQCLKMAINSLKEGKSIFIDRCNLDKEQCSDFIKLGGPGVAVHAVVLEHSTQVCISRSVKRAGHEGNLQGGRAAAVVNKMLQSKVLPKVDEGFSRILFCYNDGDVENAVTFTNHHSSPSKLGCLLLSLWEAKGCSAVKWLVLIQITNIFVLRLWLMLDWRSIKYNYSNNVFE